MSTFMFISCVCVKNMKPPFNRGNLFLVDRISSGIRLASRCNGWHPAVPSLLKRQAHDLLHYRICT